MIAASFKKKANKLRWNSLKVLIIDEISMLDIALFELLNEMAQVAKKSTLPFGGIQVIVVGDFFQLPPVVKANSVSSSSGSSGSSAAIQYTIPTAPPLPPLTPTTPATNNGNKKQTSRFCFQSPLWSQTGFTTETGYINLKQVIRQNDQNFITLLNEVRIGRSSPSLMSMLDACLTKSKPLPTGNICIHYCILLYVLVYIIVLLCILCIIMYIMYYLP